MNTTTAFAPFITATGDALRRDFPLKPFAIRHKLADHPLLSLPRIAQLAAELPRDLIEYNSGKVAISQDPDAIPSVDLDPVEVVNRIETAGAWMVLKRVENSPEYRTLLEDTLLSVARARGFNSVADAGFEQVEGFLFVSSPNSTTPFHLDSEDNFLRPYPRRKAIHHLRQHRPRHRRRRRDRALDDQAPQSEIRRALCVARDSVSSVRGRRLLRALSVAALGAHSGLLLDLDGDHLEDARGPPQQRPALLQFVAARRRPAAEAAGPAAGAGRAEACALSDGDISHQAAAQLHGDAPPLRRIALGKKANYYLKDA